MTKITCDKCRKEIVSNMFISTNKVTINRHRLFQIEYDLCDRCLLEVRNFIENVKPEPIEL